MKSLFKVPAKLALKKLQKKTSRSSFAELRAVDNFYQTSLFFPMPAVLVSTLTDKGKTTCGPYSLLAPFYVAGKDYYAFMLECRNSSNTAQNLIKHKKCVINFMADDRKTFKEMVRLGWPGDTPEEKMKDWTLSTARRTTARSRKAQTTMSLRSTTTLTESHHPTEPILSLELTRY